MIGQVAAVVQAFGGKLALGGAAAALTLSGAHAAGAVDVPGLPDNDRDTAIIETAAPDVEAVDSTESVSQRELDAAEIEPADSNGQAIAPSVLEDDPPSTTDPVSQDIQPSLAPTTEPEQTDDALESSPTTTVWHPADEDSSDEPEPTVDDSLDPSPTTTVWHPADEDPSDELELTDEQIAQENAELDDEFYLPPDALEFLAQLGDEYRAEEDRLWEQVAIDQAEYPALIEQIRAECYPAAALDIPGINAQFEAAIANVQQRLQTEQLSPDEREELEWEAAFLADDWMIALEDVYLPCDDQIIDLEWDAQDIEIDAYDDLDAFEEQLRARYNAKFPDYPIDYGWF